MSVNSFNGISCVLLDIEGTTTPIDFVFGTLFPYSSKMLPAFLRDFGDRVDVKSDLQTLRQEFEKDTDLEKPSIDATDGCLHYLLYLVKIDRKSPALKSIQGKIWEFGFSSGELKGQLFADIPSALSRFSKQGKKVAIYSSGSILAQKLLFSHSIYGNLSNFISNYFDTSTGPKRDSESYRKIANELKLEPYSILFVSDVQAEIEAARTAGFQVLYSVRDGNRNEGEVSAPKTSNLDDVKLT